MALNRVVKLSVMAIAVVASAALVPAAAHADEYNKSYPVTGRAQVHVDTNDGAVRVITVPGAKSVEFHVEYQGLQLEKNLHIESHQNGDSVELIARMTGHWGFSIGWGNNRRLRIEVHMPREADLDVQTGDGSVETEALNGGLHVHTGDGSVRSDSVSGSVDIYTGDGSITLEGAKGDIRLRTGDGHIEARQLDGKLEATSGDGHITIAGRFDQLSVKTGDGSINALASQGSKMGASWTIHTGDGSVDLTLPGDLQADIDASTHDGHISLGIPVTVEGTFSNSQIHGKMNGGGQVLSVHTGDGSIRLKKS
ncbi:MAG TPA: DUF4097 family beta strand repeat-containing protein [Candidatus Acidoferrales bacterium]|nr:DUF4097 family beta strand repeat-containing protein [Candidatus Acidoferrales bacterium]